MMVNFSPRRLADRTVGVADGTGVGRAELEAVAGIDLDRVKKPPADEFGACDDRTRGADIFLQQVQAIHRRFVGVAGEVCGEAVAGQEELHAEPLAAAVRLQNDRLTNEVPQCGGADVVAAGHQHGARRGNAVAFQCGVLPCLADLEVQRTGSVDHAPAPAGEPGKHRGGEFGGEAVVARVRGGAHAIVEHASRRWRGEVEGAGVEEPLGPGQPALVERLGERRQPGGILVQDVDAAHIGSPEASIAMEIDFSFLRKA